LSAELAGPGECSAAKTPEELEALRRSVVRGAPFGSERWQLVTHKACLRADTHRQG